MRTRFQSVDRMEFFLRAKRACSRLGILPGTFNPPTTAHLALARAALSHVDEVVFVLPHQFPHKPYSGASFAERIQMLRAALADMPDFSIAASQGGLFVEIAAECRASYGENVRLAFLCGRDAAQRIVGWDYGRPGAIREMLSRFDLLVAARGGEYLAPPELRPAIRQLALSGDFDEVSSTEVRRRIARGEPWQHLVPEPIREPAARIYGTTAPYLPPEAG